MNTNDQESFKVDVEKVIRSQRNKFVKKLPKFIIKYLKRVLREKDLNEINGSAVHLTGIPYIKKCLETMNVTTLTYGKENIDLNGRYIFVCNHPLGGIDFFAAAMAISEFHEEIKVIANEILMHVLPIKDMFLPVNVFGKNSEKDKERIVQVMASKNIQLVTFPSGSVARKYNGKLEEGEWHRSFIRHAITYKRNIIPVYIDAENSNKFYRISRFRKKLGLKTNIELFLLPQELVKKKNSTIKVTFGHVIPYTIFDGKKSHNEWAQEIKNKVCEMKYQKKCNFTC